LYGGRWMSQQYQIDP